MNFPHVSPQSSVPTERTTANFTLEIFLTRVDKKVLPQISCRAKSMATEGAGMHGTSVLTEGRITTVSISQIGVNIITKSTVDANTITD